MKKISCLLAIFPLILGLGLGANASSANSVESIVKGTTFQKKSVRDALGRTITYFVSSPKSAPKPLLLMIQGSGCAPLIKEQPSGPVSSLYNLLPFGQDNRFTVIAVEKPFSGDVGQGCSAEFNADFTAESWLVALQASLSDARKAASVDKRRMLVVGMSEGAVMAALLAANDPLVTDVVMIGGSGTTQVYDFIARSYKACFDTSQCLADLDSKVKAITSNPDSSTSFAWGHTYKRWSSFFRIDASNELLRTNARVYLAFGTEDTSVPALSQEIAVAKLMVAGRDLTVRRVVNAGHNLLLEGARDYSPLDKELRTALDWFFIPPPSSVVRIGNVKSGRP